MSLSNFNVVLPSKIFGLVLYCVTCKIFPFFVQLFQPFSVKKTHFSLECNVMHDIQ